MTFSRASVAAFCLLAAAACAQPPDPTIHVWAHSADAPTIENRLNEHLTRAQAALDRLLAVKGPRTIENTLVPFDEATEELDTAAFQSGVMQTVHPQKAVRDLAQAMVQKASAAQTALSLNQPVYQALASLDISQADAATRYYVTRQLLEFKLAGVDRDLATRKRIKAVNDELAKLGTEFERNTQDDVRKIKVANGSELDGLPQDFIARHTPAADGAITLTSDPPDVFPVLKFAKSADLRRRVFQAYSNRAYPQNEPLLADILAKREELAGLLGYPHWADLFAVDKMVHDAKTISGFIDSLDAASRSSADREYQMLLATARKQEAGINSLSSSDRSYWNEQLRRAEFDFDSQQARPYFAYERVQKGILDVASRLFRVSFRPVPDADTWDPSVSTFDVFEGEHRLGRIYLDMHPREGKDKWFSSNPILDGRRGQQLPEATLICNFPGGVKGDPGLMEYGDVETFFHEFGHLMHWIFQGQRQWAGLGSSLEWDFVEAPSQMLEEWLHDAGVLQTFARHYQTNEPISAEMVRKMNRADAFGRATWVRLQLAFTNISFSLHNEPSDLKTLDQTYDSMMARYLPYRHVDDTHAVANFGHLVGYTSAYYTYMWDRVIAEDFFSQFDHNKLLDGDTALRYRKTVLDATGEMPANDLVRNFLGRPQKIDAFVAWMNEEFLSQ